MAEQNKIRWHDHKFDIRQCKPWTKEDAKINYAERMGCRQECLKAKEGKSG